jgi:hypothetical protein
MSDAARIAQLVVKHRHGLLAYLYGVLPDAHVAEDLFQEVCVVAVQKAAEFQDGTNFRRLGPHHDRRNKLAESAPAAARRRVGRRFLRRPRDPRSTAVRVDADARKEALGRCLGEIQDRARQMLSGATRRADGGLRSPSGTWQAEADARAMKLAAAAGPRDPAGSASSAARREARGMNAAEEKDLLPRHLNGDLDAAEQAGVPVRGLQASARAAPGAGVAGWRLDEALMSEIASEKRTDRAPESGRSLAAGRAVAAGRC